MRYTAERGPHGTEFLGFGVDGISFHPNNPPCQLHLDDITGKSVHHSHVLSHEDPGMMEAIEIVE